LRWHAGRAAQPAGRRTPRCCATPFPIAETGFDPAQISDLYSRTVAAAIFDAPLAYAYLERGRRKCGAQHRGGAAGDQRWRPHLHLPHPPGHPFPGRPGVQGPEARAHRGRLRLQRSSATTTPSTKAPTCSSSRTPASWGLSELRKRLVEDRQPFDYDAEVEGLKQLDRYTFQVRIKARRRASTSCSPTAP
jgi:hypothetical protein